MIIEPEDSAWLPYLFKVKRSIIADIWRPLLAITLLSTAITALNILYGWFTAVSALPFTLVGLSLSIFLGFRNNTSYERFWEGRKLWGQLVNTSRTSTRQILTLLHTNHPHEQAELRQFQHQYVYRTIAFVHALRLHLRASKELSELSAFLPAHELALKDQVNPPNAILLQQGHELCKARLSGWVNPYQANLLEETLMSMTDVQGGCERIRSTPVPFPYIALLHTIVSIYCFLLPFGIVDDVGWLTPVAVFMVSYIVIGIEAIGDALEKSLYVFTGGSPLTAISRNIEINLRQMLGETALPHPLEPVDGILH